MEVKCFFFTTYCRCINITIIPSLYIASKIVKDRPFSSYSSSRGEWNFRLYFKALTIPSVLYISYVFLDAAITGSKGTFQLSIPFLIVLFIFLPLPSIAEEYAFRGLIMQTLRSWLNIPVLAVILQTVIFLFGFFAWKTNGIGVSSASHTARNFHCFICYVGTMYINIIPTIILCLGNDYF